MTTQQWYAALSLAGLLAFGGALSFMKDPQGLLAAPMPAPVRLSARQTSARQVAQDSATAPSTIASTPTAAAAQQQTTSSIQGVTGEEGQEGTRSRREYNDD